VQLGKSSSTVMVSSPVQSDEECLSPHEEEMEVGDSPSLNKGISFSQPPSFQVRICIKLNQLKYFQYVVGCRAKRVGDKRGLMAKQLQPRLASSTPSIKCRGVEDISGL